MSLPFAPRDVMTNAQRRGFRPLEASKIAAVAFHQLQTLQTLAPYGRTITAAEVATALKQRAVKETERANRAEANLRALGIVIPEWPMIPEGYFTRDSEDDSLDDAAMEDDVPLRTGFDVEQDHLSGGPKKKFKFEPDGVDVFFGGNTPYNPEDHMSKLSLKHTSHDIITALCQHAELAVELGKHLGPRDILNLYSVSRSFHEAVRNHMYSTVKMWLKFNAPIASQVFSFRLYRRHLVPDPSGRTWVGQDPGAQSQIPAHLRNDTRLIPGIKYLQMVLGRVRYCREIIAILARNGHRLPKGMLSTLVRLWLLMEVATTAQRQALLRSPELWSERDLYNAQFFFVKLGMHCIDPVFGPAETELVDIMLGQKGLYPLWQLLMCKKYTKLHEFRDLKVRYDYEIPHGQWDDRRIYYGVPCPEVGVGHLEGWGKGIRHLLRPNELIPIEAVARGLELDEHLMDMVIWGYIDFSTGENLVPTEDEIYISDDENVLKHVDTRHHWKRKHALKKRWNDLTPQQQQEIIKDDEQERLRSLAFCGDYENGYTGSDEVCSDDGSDGWSSSTYSLDDEIRRGMPLRPQPECNPSEAPALDDTQAWANFINDTLLGMGPDVGVGEDQILIAQEWETYDDKEMFTTFNWGKWLHDNIDGPVPSGDDDDGDDEDGDYDDDDDDDDGEDEEMDDADEDDGSNNDGDDNGNDNFNGNDGDDGSDGDGDGDGNNDSNNQHGGAHVEETGDETQDESTEEDSGEEETENDGAGGDGDGEEQPEGEGTMEGAFETQQFQQNLPEQNLTTQLQQGQYSRAQIDPQAYAMPQVHMMVEEDFPAQMGQLQGIVYQGPAANQEQPGQEQSGQQEGATHSPQNQELVQSRASVQHRDVWGNQVPGERFPASVGVPMQQSSQQSSQRQVPVGYQAPAQTQQSAQHYIPVQQQQQTMLQHQMPAQNQAPIQPGVAQPQAAQYQGLQQQQGTEQQRRQAQLYRQFQQFKQLRAQQTQQIQQMRALQPPQRQRWLAQQLHQLMLTQQAQRQQELRADQQRERQNLESRHAQENLAMQQMLVQNPGLLINQPYLHSQEHAEASHLWERQVMERSQEEAQRRVRDTLPAGMRNRPRNQFWPLNSNMRQPDLRYEGPHPLLPNDEHQGPVQQQGGFGQGGFIQAGFAQGPQIQPPGQHQVPVLNQQLVQHQLPNQNQQFSQHQQPVQHQAQQPAHSQVPIQAQQFAQHQQLAQPQFTIHNQQLTQHQLQHQLPVQNLVQHQGQVQPQGMNLPGSQDQDQPQWPAQG